MKIIFKPCISKDRRLSFYKMIYNLIKKINILIICEGILAGWIFSGLTINNVHAATFTVTKSLDSADGICDADCSLREAIMAANASPGPDRITIPQGTYKLTIEGINEDGAATGDLDITDELILNGAGESITIIDGAGIDRVLDVDPAGSGVKASISGVTIQNGNAPHTGKLETCLESAGGITNKGNLALEHVTVRNNQAIYFSGGGGIYNKGTISLKKVTINDNSGYRSAGIGNDGVMTMHDCWVINNRTNGSNGSGGGIGNGGIGALTYCTVSNNTALNGGGILNAGDMSLANTTISGNTASLSIGGGIINYNNSFLTISNCTIQGNRAQTYGGGIFNKAVAALGNVTIVGNEAISGAGGGIYNTLEISIENTLLANNVASGYANNCFLSGGQFSNYGYNLEDANTCGFSQTGDLVNVNPQLGPLQNNGGLIFTVSLLPGSPAIDAGNPEGCFDVINGPPIPLNVDQRGFTRPIDGNGDSIKRCDIGAYEYGSTAQKGDIDSNGKVNLIDAILVFQVYTGQNPVNIRSDYAASGADVNNNQKIGVEEAIYILQKVAGVR